MELGAVRNWARSEGLTDEEIQIFHDEALQLASLRLLQAAHRESFTGDSSLGQTSDGEWYLSSGIAPSIRILVNPPLPFGRLEAVGMPEAVDGRGSRPLMTSDAFLTALTVAWSHTSCPFDRLVYDFKISLANLILNRVIFARRKPHAPFLEPAYGGHNYYPFPGLRDGIALREAIECSHISGESTLIPLVAMSEYRFVGGTELEEVKCFQAWSGCRESEWIPGIIPLHPWQAQNSPVVASARKMGLIVEVPSTLMATPLASQRTCRMCSTGYDIKLPVNATITGERRLLYSANAHNAPGVSSLVREIQQVSDTPRMGFQYDVASLTFADPIIGTHLAMIVREPIRVSSDKFIAPALLLWSAPYLADEVFLFSGRESIEELFTNYCNVVMRGPLEWYARWGMAFEPHLQNSLIEIDNHQPVRLVLRDLDSTIMDEAQVTQLLRKHGVDLAMTPWGAMPPWEDGGRRLLHALFYAHIGQVIAFLARHRDADPDILADCVEGVWKSILSSHSGAARDRLDSLRELGHPVKRLLALRMRRSMDMSWA